MYINIHPMGLRTLFNDPAEEQKPAQEKPGRFNVLQEQESECMADVYYWFSKHKELKYEACIREVAKRFFLSQLQTERRLQKNTEYFRKLKKEPLTKEELSAKWPWVVFK